MAYDTLKAEIRQYINTNGANEITGQILQNVLLDMVNAYPSLDGYATQQWVQNQLSDMATMTWVGQNFVQNSALNNYLPLSGGVMTGPITAGTLSTGSYSLGNTGLGFSYSSNGSPRYAHQINISSVDNTITFYGRSMTVGTVIETGQITSDKFIVTNGTSAQFLKADGSVDSTSYLPLTGGTITGNLGVNGYLTFGSNLLYSGNSDFYIGRNNSGAVNTGNARLRLGANLAMLYSGLSYNFFGLDSGGNFVCRLYDALVVIDQNQNDKIILLYSYDEYNGALRTDCDFISSGSVTGSSFIKNGGTSSQFLKADGSVDSNTYLTTAILSGYATETWVGNNYLALSGGTITGNTELDGNLVVDGTCYLGGTSAQNAIVNIADSAQIVQTNQSYQPYLLFHKPNVNRTRLAMADDGTIEVRAGENGTAFRKFACGRITVDGGSDGCGLIYIDSDGININGYDTDADKVYLSANDIYCAGNTEINGNCYADSFIQNSDVRLKNIVSDLNLNIYNVANAPIFKYTWKDGKDNQALHVGTSAQYWQTVLPETVSEKKDGMLAMQYDVVALAGVTTVAKVVVDHEQRIAELEKENALLKAKLNIN